eukprot:3231379-Amphidinium_carterae.1
MERTSSSGSPCCVLLTVDTTSRSTLQPTCGAASSTCRADGLPKRSAGSAPTPDCTNGGLLDDTG